jgi:regulator of RNase E activity RraB
MCNIDIEEAIRSIVRTSVDAYAVGFADRHIGELNDPDGVINMKINNVFIAALGRDIQYYSALVRSLDSSLGNMLEQMAINIAKLNYEVSQHVEGILKTGQTEYIADLLEEYKRHARIPNNADYEDLITEGDDTSQEIIRHESDYYLIDKETNHKYLIELKIGGDLDNKKARSEKEALLEQYCILSNSLGSNKNISIHFATAYNRYGEDEPWNQGRVLQYFSREELLIGKDFWNMICKREDGYNIVLDEYKKNANKIINALNKIKNVYLEEE